MADAEQSSKEQQNAPTSVKRPPSPTAEPELENVEEKQKKLDQQMIYYPHQEQPDLNTFDEDVEEIDLSLSRVRHIDDFSRFKRLRNLCFRSNLIKSLAEDNLSVSKGFQQIEELDFYDNQIEKIENLSQFSETLKILDLSFNRFKKIENVEQLVNLKKIFFVHNNITKIENLDRLNKLELLELGDNQLRQIENLNALTNLTQLYVNIFIIVY